MDFLTKLLKIKKTKKPKKVKGILYSKNYRYWFLWNSKRSHKNKR
jgi:hypothetical protein